MDETTDRLLRLLDQCGPRLHALLTRLTLRHEVADELLQELFVRMSRSSGFRRAPAPERYLFRSAIHLAFDWRRQNRQWAGSRQIADDDLIVECNAVEAAMHREQMERVLGALDRLSARHRELITLRYIHELSMDELAAHLGTTQHRARAVCSKALARLRKLLAPDAATQSVKKTPYE